MAFYARHVCRLEPWPDALLASFGALAPDVYGALWGPSEMRPDGALRDWDPVARLGAVAGPVLVTNGAHDEVTPAEGERLAKAMPQAERVVFADSAHVAHLEEPERFRRTLEAFLARAD